MINFDLVIEPKDIEASALYKQYLKLLLQVWSNVNVKFPQEVSSLFSTFWCYVVVPEA